MKFLIYGAYGYTGRLIAEEAVERGHRPILAGRNARKVNALGDDLGLPAQAVSLEKTGRLRSVLEDVSVVVHCAGPYVHTAEPMVDACLDTSTHYLDLTGEVDVFQSLAERDQEAEQAGIILLPGIGFDVAASDCLGRFVAEQVGSATTLEIALYTWGGVSRGTLRTLIENMDQPGLVRREGTLREVPHGWTSRIVDFGDRERQVVSIPEGSVVTSGYSTDVPNVTVYFALPKIVRSLLGNARYIRPIATWGPVRRVLHSLVDHRASGPSTEERERGRTIVWATARTRHGDSATARLYAPDAYTFTARSTVEAVEKLTAGMVSPGYQTPSTALGADFPLEISGVEREIVASAS